MKPTKRPEWFTKAKYLEYKAQGMTDREIHEGILFVSLKVMRNFKIELGVIGTRVSRNRVKRTRRLDYAVYKGEELLFIGTADECAKYLGVKTSAIWGKAWRTKVNRHKSKYSVVSIGRD